MSPERRHAIRPGQFPTEEQLKDYTMNQALAGDTTGARQSVKGIANRTYLREAWQTILFVEAGHRDVQGVKDTIVSCPDQSLLRCHTYHDIPLGFLKDGNLAGAIEIAQTMGDFGVLPLLLIVVNLIDKGDFVRVRETLPHIPDNAMRAFIMNMMDERHAKDRDRPDTSQP
ncbi:MAG: hypothetical protein OEU68_00985 [Nitrospira sp.]|nr:hypothetical protein [Nitrospira sp.]MDH4245688.1 hypothetical protein [Nitrospira sp.]MDH4354467.1 hypothetical protein [Nitrospira sp.]MDH5319220.1 hypothetical protein [Nitrospira sp.]